MILRPKVITFICILYICYIRYIHRYQVQVSRHAAFRLSHSLETTLDFS